MNNILIYIYLPLLIIFSLIGQGTLIYCIMIWWKPDWFIKDNSLLSEIKLGREETTRLTLRIEALELEREKLLSRLFQVLK